MFVVFVNTTSTAHASTFPIPSPALPSKQPALHASGFDTHAQYPSSKKKPHAKPRLCRHVHQRAGERNALLERATRTCLLPFPFLRSDCSTRVRTNSNRAPPFYACAARLPSLLRALRPVTARAQHDPAAAVLSVSVCPLRREVAWRRGSCCCFRPSPPSTQWLSPPPSSRTFLPPREGAPRSREDETPRGQVPPSLARVRGGGQEKEQPGGGGLARGRACRAVGTRQRKEMNSQSKGR